MDQDIFTADPRLRPQRGPADRSHCCHPVRYGQKITERGGQTCRGMIYICHNMTEYESCFVILYNYTLNL